MTFHIRDTREGVEVFAVSVGGIRVEFPCGARLSAYEIMRLSQVEDVYLSAPDGS